MAIDNKNKTEYRYKSLAQANPAENSNIFAMSVLLRAMCLKTCFILSRGSALVFLLKWAVNGK